ncbi:MAG: ABC transporter ATP-binding protein, partial [Clostridiales bacterium]|nr:ABC transporter ATP-binding protein [Clostridiales bacterium]
MEQKKRRKGITIMGQLIGLVKPLLPIMCLAILLGVLGYLMVGAVISLWNGKKGAAEGMEFRNSFGELNSFILDSLRGIDETIQYDKGKERMEQMDEHSKKLGQMQKKLNRHEAYQSSLTNMVILMFS